MTILLLDPVESLESVGYHIFSSSRSFWPPLLMFMTTVHRILNWRLKSVSGRPEKTVKVCEKLEIHRRLHWRLKSYSESANSHKLDEATGGLQSYVRSMKYIALKLRKYKKTHVCLRAVASFKICLLTKVRGFHERAGKIHFRYFASKFAKRLGCYQLHNTMVKPLDNWMLTL